MRKIWNSFLIAFSMFSKIPVPEADWEKENMRYMMCFFPLIGVVIGALVWGYGVFAEWIGVGSLMRSAGYVLIPVIVTGGIHLDGFLDTVDALSSCQPRERKLEILKDPHAGAFAIIMGCAYFVLSLGIWSEMAVEVLPVIGSGYVISRTLSGLALTDLPSANKNGSLGMFADAAQKYAVRVVLIIYFNVCVVFACMWNWKLGALMCLAALAAFSYYYRLAKKEFGGTTGDVAGYFVQVCELVMACAVMFGGKLL